MATSREYTLFCAPDTYAMIVHAVLEDVGADYDIRWIEIFTDNPDPDFLAASPHARTPALAGPDGTLFETGAIALYIAERFPDANLVIKVTDPRRGKFLQWFHYLASSLQPEVLIQYHPEFYTDDKASQYRLKEASKKRLTVVLNVLNNALETGPYFFGDQLSIIDFILAMQAVWDVIYPTNIDDYPNIKNMLEKIRQRNSVRHVFDLHQAELKRRKTIG